MISFDHWKLVRRDLKEVKRFRDHVLGGQAGETVQADVFHRRDFRCCKSERWEDTVETLVAAMKPATPYSFSDVDCTEGGGEFFESQWDCDGDCEF